MNDSESFEVLTTTSPTPITTTASSTVVASTRSFIHHPPRIDPDLYQADVPDWCPPSLLQTNGS